MSSDHDVMALSIKRGEETSTYDDMISASTCEQLEHCYIISTAISCSYHSHVGRTKGVSQKKICTKGGIVKTEDTYVSNQCPNTYSVRESQ